jgi:hypothetical protein
MPRSLVPNRQRPRTVLLVLLVPLLGTIAAATLMAAQGVTLRGTLHDANPNTFRVIAGRGGQIWDATAEGLKVGVAPDGEERIAFCRPGFFDATAPFRNYTVVSAAMENNAVGATLYIPPAFWDMATPPATMFAMRDANPQKATPQAIAALFTTLLANENNPSGNLGLMLRSTQNLRSQPASDIVFVVTLSIPFAIRIAGFYPLCPDPRILPAPPTPQPITDFVMDWTSSCSGFANVQINNRVINSLPLRVTGQKIAHTVVPRQVLVRGANAVSLAVQEDDASVGQAYLTTSVTLTISAIICPWNPRFPPPLSQPPR